MLLDLVQRKPLGRVFFKKLLYEIPERLGRLVQLAEDLPEALFVLSQQLVVRVTIFGRFERRRLDHHGEEDDTRGEEVGRFGVVGLDFGRGMEFRRIVLGRANMVGGLEGEFAAVFVDCFCAEAEICKFQRSVREENVFGFDISMRQAALMEVFDTYTEF